MFSYALGVLTDIRRSANQGAITAVYRISALCRDVVGTAFFGRTDTG